MSLSRRFSRYDLPGIMLNISVLVHVVDNGIASLLIPSSRRKYKVIGDSAEELRGPVALL